ncbi:hypothetical protein RN02_30050 [Pseudomonas sp. PI1]|nr:hypothetical protein RN02_30050 [Pseudomonas sp. PI1]
MGQGMASIQLCELDADSGEFVRKPIPLSPMLCSLPRLDPRSRPCEVLLCLLRFLTERLTLCHQGCQ